MQLFFCENRKKNRKNAKNILTTATSGDIIMLSHNCDKVLRLCRFEVCNAIFLPNLSHNCDKPVTKNRLEGQILENLSPPPYFDRKGRFLALPVAQLRQTRYKLGEERKTVQ